MDFLWLIIAVTFCTLKEATTQTENTDTLESCNVVCNCNSGQSPESTSQNRQLTNQGPPGKLGPKGDVGSVGAKGEKGDTGFKGQKGTKGAELSLPDVLGALSATSCKDLHERFHISRPDYYLVKDASTASPVYVYCDFRRYPDVTNCDQLFQKYNHTHRGYYLFGQNIYNGTFQYCKGVTPTPGIYTCQAFRQLHPGLSHFDSGSYEFHSTIAGATFSVHCDFSQTPAVTEIHHNLMEERHVSSTCGSRGCFAASPKYDVSATNLMRIIDNSASCRQFLKLRCRGVLIRRDNYAWWVSKDGQKMSYWGGASRSNYCACGETNSCIDKSYKCNCDQNSNDVTTSDEGYITDKTKLPLQDIKIGDVDDRGENAWYTIGKLECFGQV